MAEAQGLRLQQLLISLQNSPQLQDSFISAIKNNNEELEKDLKNLTTLLNEEEVRNSSLQIDINKETAKMEQLQSQIAFDRNLLTEEENNNKSIKDEIDGEKMHTMDIVVNHQSLIEELGETFRSTPDKYKPVKIQQEIHLLIEKATKVQKDITTIEEQVATLKQTLLQSNKDDISHAVEDIIRDVDDFEKIILNLSTNETRVNEEIEKLNKEIQKLEILRNKLLTDLENL